MGARDDDLKDSFYLYIMRNSIGAGLRSKYAPKEQMPDRLAALLHELEDDDTPAAAPEAEAGEGASRQPPDTGHGGASRA